MIVEREEVELRAVAREVASVGGRMGTFAAEERKPVEERVDRVGGVDVEIAADTDYTVAISTGTSPLRNYPNLSDLAMGGNNGLHLSYPADAGKFTTTKDARPTLSFNSVWPAATKSAALSAFAAGSSMKR